MPLLSICIPTYKRERFLVDLVDVLIGQISQEEISQEIEIIVSDNDPESEIASLLRNQIQNNTFFTYIKNKTNIGPKENLMSLYEKVNGKYIWFLGDDDLPAENAIQEILHLLKNYEPNLIFLKPQFTSNHKSFIPKSHEKINFFEVNAKKFIINSQMHITFTSSLIFNNTKYSELEGKLNYRQFINTNFCFLEFILSLLKTEKKLFTSNDILITAFGGTQGGYDVINAFGVELIKIIDTKLESSSFENKFMKKIILTAFIPSICHSMKEQSLGNFKLDYEKAKHCIDLIYKKNIVLKFICNMQLSNKKLVRSIGKAIYRLNKYALLLTENLRIKFEIS